MRYLFSILCFLVPGLALSKSPPSFTHQNGKAVFVDFQRTYLELDLNTQAQIGKAKAKIGFLASEVGYPVFDLVPNVSKIELNGVATSESLVSVDGGETRVRVVNAQHVIGYNELYIEYNYPSSELSFSNGGVSTLWATSDLGSGRQFMEQYFPSNFEYDQFLLEMRVKISGTTTEHEIFTNASVQALSSGEWALNFPEWYTSSSHFLHLTTKGRFTVSRGEFQSVTGDKVPLVLYGSDPQQALNKTKQVLQELEGVFGPYAHGNFVGYMTASGGGMEHCGGAITTYGALAHEITHSWFARGVMPADGNSGWLDEATASWRDNGWPRASGEPNRSPVNLSGHSAYRRQTDNASYGSGSKFLSELDYVFRADGGMRKLLSAFYQNRKQTTMQTIEFRDFLMAATGKDLTQWFDRYVYGRGGLSEVIDAPVGLENVHPKPLTRKEIDTLR